jgi:hypothetical protein
MATRSSPKYNLSGRITNLQDEPLEGLVVRAFDQDPRTPDNPLGEEVDTNAEGHYTIRFTGADFRIGGVESSGLDVFIGRLVSAI